MNIDIAIIAWPKTAERLSYLQRTLESIRENLTNRRGLLRIYVSIEATDVPENLARETEELLAGFRIEQIGDALMQEPKIMETKPRWLWRRKAPSLGGNMNDALRMCKGDFILLTQDDWTWNQPVELSLDATQLEHNLDFSLIRYAAFFCEYTHPLTERLWNVDMSSQYVYGDQPHLRRATFADEFGWYVESKTGDFGTPEHAMADRLKADGWRIAAYNPAVVEHCGTLSSCEKRQVEVLR